jgi:hypothetical protein
MRPGRRVVALTAVSPCERPHASNFCFVTEVLFRFVLLCH